MIDRRQAFVEKLALIVAHDDHGFGRDLLELLAEHFHRPAALRETLAPGLDRRLRRRNPGARSLQQRFVVVGLAAEPVLLVLAIGLRAQIPLLGRRRQQRPVRRSHTQYDFSHEIPSRHSRRFQQVRACRPAADAILPYRISVRAASGRSASPVARRSAGQHDSGEGDDQHAHEQRVGGEGLSAVGDHEADALAAAEHLADHHADQSQRDALTDAGQDERHGAGNRDGREDLPVRGAEGARGAQQIAVDRLDAADGVDQDREERRDKNDEDLRPHADPEPDDDERDHGDARRGIQRVQERSGEHHRHPLYQPTITPSTTPATTASTNPMTKFLPL